MSVTEQVPDNETIETWAAEAAAMLPRPVDWIKLTLELRRAAAIDHTEAAGAELPGHSASWVALKVLYDFLAQQEIFLRDPAPLAPLVRLFSAMTDLRQGQVAPMFRPARKRGTPPNPSGFEIVKGTAARAMSELIKAGDSPDEASRKVAAACSKLPGAGRITASVIATARERLNRRPCPGAPKDGPARFAYDRAVPGDTPRERAENILAELPKLAPQLVEVPADVGRLRG